MLIFFISVHKDTKNIIKIKICIQNKKNHKILHILKECCTKSNHNENLFFVNPTRFQDEFNSSCLNLANIHSRQQI